MSDAIDGIIAAQTALILGIVTLLDAKGLISRQEVCEFIDQATLLLEQKGLAEPKIQSQHTHLLWLRQMIE